VLTWGAMNEPLQRVVGAVVTRSHRLLQRLIGRTKDGQRDFFDTETLPWVRNVEAHWSEVREELDTLLGRLDELPNFQDIQQEQRELTNDDRWRVFPFYAYGERVEHNCARCPKTDAVLRSIPGMTTGMFSILLPHKHIPPHVGPWKGVLRYHLALRTPADEQLCRIRVGERTRHWQLGKSLVFDDTFQHEVWNDSDEIRVVLFVDFIRDLPWPLAVPNRLFIGAIRKSAFIQDALRRVQGWEETLLERAARRSETSTPG
jgi:aspartyl/asparaginyl beta-hydroxylase (cupin superfamily)